jgi:hypothetical protein
MLQRIKLYLKDLFTTKTTNFYLIKRVEDYYGLRKASYLKEVVVVRTGDRCNYMIDHLQVKRLVGEGWVVVTEDEFNKRGV